jgi:hypothetical protein
MDESTKQLGLLMQTAENHQKLAKSHLQLAEVTLDRLQEQTRDLGTVVRETARGAVSQALQEGLRDVHAESQRAVTSLRELYSETRFRLLWLTALCSVFGLAIGVGASFAFIPSKDQIAQLRATVEALEGQGGLADVADCHQPHKKGRLCVRVDVKEGGYGEERDYFIIKGY